MRRIEDQNPLKLICIVLQLLYNLHRLRDHTNNNRQRGAALEGSFELQRVSIQLELYKFKFIKKYIFFIFCSEKCVGAEILYEEKSMWLLIADTGGDKTPTEL